MRKNAKRASERRFTLVELLAVVAILLILVALLLPSLEQAREKSMQIVCQSNLKQQGVAMMGHLADNDRKFPVYPSWSTLSGVRGTRTHYNSNLYGINDRPLNKYLNDVGEVSECPSDRGDSHPLWVGDGINNCFESYGNSYQAPWGYDYNRTRYLGHSSTPNRLSKIAHSTTNKIMLGDWTWWGNRPFADAKTRWHSQTKRLFSMVYADGHGQMYEFPFVTESWLTAPAPDSSFDWW